MCTYIKCYTGGAVGGLMSDILQARAFTCTVSYYLAIPSVSALCSNPWWYIHMWLDLTKPGLTLRAMLGDMAISSYNSIIGLMAYWYTGSAFHQIPQSYHIYSFLMNYAEEMKITTSTGLFLSYIVWVNNFQAPKIQAVWAAFFMAVMILQGVVIWVGVEGGLNIGVENGIWRQLKARSPVWGPTGPFLCSQHFKLKITDIGQPFVACPVLQTPMQESHDHSMMPKHHSRLTQGLRKAATETRLVTLEQGTEWNMIVYWASNPFLVKSQVWYCVCANQVFQIRSHMCKAFLNA